MSKTEKPADEKSKTEQDEQIDISRYQGHFALEGKNKGCSEVFLGKVCLVGFLVHDRTSAWTEENVKQMKHVLQKAAHLLKEKSKLSDNRLKISYAFDSVPVQYKYEREDYMRVVEDVLEQYGFSDAASYQAHYEKRFKKTEAPLIFFINRDFRSFASCDVSKNENKNSGEFSFVSFDDDPEACVRTLIHEVLHQFGAIDYYLPKKVKEVAQELFPESIMLHGLEIDDLTRYLIGWDNTPTPAALQFLDETADVTEQEIKEAREKDKDNDW